MGYHFTIHGGVHPKVEGHYPWPCDAEPDRTIHLYTDDVLTKHSENGTYTKHTGMGCFNIVLTDDQVVACDGPQNLQLI